MTDRDTRWQSKGPTPLPGEPPKTKNDKKGFGELGPAWIGAIATLITALTGAGFFVGRSTAPAPVPSAHSSVTEAIQATGLQQAPSALSSVPSSPATIAVQDGPAEGTVLWTCNLDMPDYMGILVKPSSQCPAPVDIWTLANNGLSVAYNVGLAVGGATSTAVSDEASPSYNDCKSTHKYFSQDLSLPGNIGKSACIIAPGLVVAVNLVRISTNLTSSVVTLNLTVWSGSKNG
ncbi:hypothetical protein CRH09_36000 [Nocardia terpenica]|uniref:Uncharacterized protein n=1 Tax=Nocardia terpenica TaxID=455432 RepID=A0A291RU61_9NOCA|nr:hypothetical protein CRH09_36000 [Nocardia terpenica]